MLCGRRPDHSWHRLGFVGDECGFDGRLSASFGRLGGMVIPSGRLAHQLDLLGVAVGRAIPFIARL
jgi:hypothetical protein